MKTIKDMTFGGERPLFESHNLRMENITITDKSGNTLKMDGIAGIIQIKSTAQIFLNT